MRDLSKVRTFYDVIFDYLDLKYIFEYGFYWEDIITKQLLGKGSQKVQELASVLFSDEESENVVYIPWTKCIETDKRKVNRKLVYQNHYRKSKSPWFLELYRNYGKYREIKSNVKLSLEQQVKFCQSECEDITRMFSLCKDNESTCMYRRRCELLETIQALLEFANGISKEREIYWKTEKLRKNIFNEYKDIIEKKKLKKNNWCFEAENSIYESKEEYERFLKMVRFFSLFTPLSVLGSNFLYHLQENTSSSYFLVRNLPLDFGLEQEYIYRILYAIEHHLLVEVEGVEYVPIRIFYKDKGFSGLEEHLYLEVETITDEEDQKSKKEFLLNQGIYVKPGRKNSKEVKEKKEEVCCIEKQEFIVEFYYNKETPYICNRIEEEWVNQIAKMEHLSEIKEMQSPYYPQSNTWNIICITYYIETQDRDGFLLFIQSFGDFAKIIKGNNIPKADTLIQSELKRGSILEYQSLLSVYYCSELSKIVQEKGLYLPPRACELMWLQHILSEYPNMCYIFLKESTLKNIKESLQQEISMLKCNDWFNKIRYECTSRIQDIPSMVVNKYAEILSAIQNKRILIYEYKNEQAHILPYALEYDVVRHLVRKEKQPFDIMCYNLDEKRNIRIKYKDIRVKKSCSNGEFEFSDLDKMYHIVAYTIRCALKGQEEVNDKIEKFLSYIWKSDARGGTIYQRCIRKKIGKYREISILYEELQNIMCKKEEDEKFLQNIFAYFVVKEIGEQEKNIMQQQYYAFF